MAEHAVAQVAGFDLGHGRVIGLEARALGAGDAPGGDGGVDAAVELGPAVGDFARSRPCRVGIGAVGQDLGQVAVAVGEVGPLRPW